MYERNEQMKEIYIIYSKKLVTDEAFDYKTTVNSWEECAEILERLAENHQVVSFMNIEDGKEILARTFDFQDNNTMTQTAGFGKS